MEQPFHKTVQALYSAWFLDELYYLPHTHGFDHCGLTLSADDKENVLDQGDIYNEAEIAREIDDEPHYFALYKILRIAESRKFVLVESGLPGIGIQNPDFGVQNPAKE